jgi:transketolase
MAVDVGSMSGTPRDWFGDALVRLAFEEGLDFTVVDCDVAGGTGAWKFRDAFPNRFVQCGISEQAAAGIAAGLAEGFGKPVVFNTFAVFGARAWEVLRLQAFYNELPVIIALSHLGLDVGEDGASAQSLSHFALWRAMPGDAPVINPCCPLEMEGALRWLMSSGKPGVLLTGRSQVKLGPWAQGVEFKAPGLLHCVFSTAGSDADDVAILASGHMVAPCVLAAQKLVEVEIRTTVYSVPSLKPIDEQGIGIIADGCPVITVEDHGPAGGLFEAVAGAVALTRKGEESTVVPLFVDGWGESGTPEELAGAHGINVDGIAHVVEEVVG